MLAFLLFYLPHPFQTSSQKKGVIFFLPPYCSEMNPIELEWEHLKRDELVGQMFESESELAFHVTEGLEARGERHGHSVKYVNLRGLK
ncbi:transposase [Lyngbya sp. PCC 8106]|uniref:transposase n=1 Tax=Lyngbya sp. (strain PCC 8106) TaxID=313612 RepID=UPI001124D8B2|nr:transposase [Lyngbya sp. PCC 8106]